MRIIALVIVTSVSLLGRAQNVNNNIGFEKEYSWNQVKEKARAEKKYIFVDCYATWCKPCKLMDLNVFSNDTVSEFLNKYFISVRMQIDSTNSDSESVRRFRTVAREFESKYKIKELPSYLFFSSDGQVVHKEVGGKNVSQFLNILKDAINANKQMYSKLKKWQEQNVPIAELPVLAEELRKNGEDSFAFAVVKDYVGNYLYKKSEETLLTKENLFFFQKYEQALSSKDKIFQFYINKPGKIDSIIGYKGFTKERINKIITKEEITPQLIQATNDGKTPNWERIHRRIRKKYGPDLAFENVINTKIRWFKERKDGKGYVKSLMTLWNAQKKEFQTYGSLYLNNAAWAVCVYSENKQELNTALLWINLALSEEMKPSAGMLDTKANILYKLGYKNEAISIEEDVVKLAVENYKKAYDKVYAKRLINRFQNIVDIMKMGKPVELSD